MCKTGGSQIKETKMICGQNRIKYNHKHFKPFVAFTGILLWHKRNKTLPGDSMSAIHNTKHIKKECL